METIVETTTDAPSKRVPLEGRVMMKRAAESGFNLASSANISMTGVFIKTDPPSDPGSLVMFEIWPDRQASMIHALGEVVWTRDIALGDDRPAGMGVRYLKIDPPSCQVIRQLVEDGAVAATTSAMSGWWGVQSAPTGVRRLFRAIGGMLGGRPPRVGESRYLH